MSARGEYTWLHKAPAAVLATFRWHVADTRWPFTVGRSSVRTLTSAHVQPSFAVKAWRGEAFAPLCNQYRIRHSTRLLRRHACIAGDRGAPRTVHGATERPPPDAERFGFPGTGWGSLRWRAARVTLMNLARFSGTQWHEYKQSTLADCLCACSLY
jgi:hypothetical protein